MSQIILTCEHFFFFLTLLTLAQIIVIFLCKAEIYLGGEKLNTILELLPVVVFKTHNPYAKLDLTDNIANLFLATSNTIIVQLQS